MNHHYVVKFHCRLPLGGIPDWVTFIDDKSVVRENVHPDVDRLMDELGLKFWTTHEYQSADDAWSDDELRHGLDRTYRLILQRDYDLPDHVLRWLRSIPAVEDARELTVARADIPVRERAADSPRKRPGDLINLGYVRELTKGVPEVKVAVLDTGVDLDHPELQGVITGGADFVNLTGMDSSNFVGNIFSHVTDAPMDEVGHGSHVSGIIAGRGLQMDEGIASGCRVVPVQVLAAMKSGDRLVGAGIVDNINAGIKWAADNGADVLNMSLGIKHTESLETGLPHQDVVNYALSKNVTVVAASGNDGTDERYYPGALPGVIAVGAADDTGAVTPFTSYGAHIAVVAPGQNIYSSFAHHGYAFASGTSQASPFVAAAVALMKSYALQQSRKLSNHDIVYVLKNTSDKPDSRLRTERAGYGLINLADAFKLLGHLLT